MDRLRYLLSKWNIELSAYQLEQFDKYYDLLISWNEKMNLTAITDRTEVIEKHFFDSIALASFSDIDGKRILDMGSGAGFPGIPLKIVYPDSNIVLIDSLAKRVNFLNTVINDLCLKNIVAVHGRAEDYARNSEYREKFDVVTSRAVANLSVLSEYCIPYVKVGGMFAPYKSSNISEEVDAAINAIDILGGKLIEVKEYNLPETDYARSIVYIKKVRNCSKKYPRKAGVPAKSPL